MFLTSGTYFGSFSTVDFTKDTPKDFLFQTLSVPTPTVSPQARAQIGSLISSATDLLRQQGQFQDLPSPTRDLLDQIVSGTQQIAASEPNSPAAREQV